MKKGSISISTLLSVVGGLAASIVWIIGYVNMVVAPIKAQADENAAQIYGINAQVTEANVKLNFILGKYGAEYNIRTQTITTSTP